MLDLDGQVHHDTHAVPMGNYVIEVGNYVIATPSELGNYKIADTLAVPLYRAPSSAEVDRITTFAAGDTFLTCLNPTVAGQA